VTTQLPVRVIVFADEPAVGAGLGGLLNRRPRRDRDGVACERLSS
jgi:hypothetical protein